MLTKDSQLFIASAAGHDICLHPAMGNRHGLVTGATGTGKTVALQSLAESFSALGVPVFLTDIKGDLSGLSQAGAPTGSVARRIEELGLVERGFQSRPYPACFWAVGGSKGHPLRATVSDLGPLLFSRLLDLNEVQSGLMHLVFHLADERGLLLLDLKDLKSLLGFVGENASQLRLDYGHIAPASIGAIQRSLLRLQQEGGELFFGEPALRLEDLLLNDLDGRGLVHILAAETLMSSPRLYGAVLLWLLSELYERLPEVGDRDKPRLVLMFDEAHLLFKDAPRVLEEKIEQVVRLIRSKGVGVYFITQSPADIPDSILAQLGNKIQFALRAFTPKEQKAVRAAAQSFRPNPAFDTAEVISQLATGQALVSFLDAKGSPTVVEKALILPPEGRVGPATDEERSQIMAQSRLAGRYEELIDRPSAYEMLTQKVEERQRELEAQQAAELAAKEAREREKAQRQSRRGTADPLGAMFQSASRSIGRELGSRLIRGILGGLFGGRK